MIIDTHSHLNFKAYDNDREEVIKRAQKEGVVCIDIGTKYETSEKAVELANKNENIYAAIGMHPIHIKGDFKFKTDENEGSFSPFGEEFDKERYLKLAKINKVVAIGEIGLDYYYKPKTNIKLNAFKEKQKEVFKKQLEIAEELSLPVILHCRMAHDEIIEIISKFEFRNSNFGRRGVIHCFTGGLKELDEYLKLGFYIGINGIIFKMNLDEVIKKCPIEKILVETDCPYLTPVQEGDKRNEPIFVKHVISKIADLKGLSFEEVAEKTSENAKKLFEI